MHAKLGRAMVLPSGQGGFGLVEVCVHHQSRRILRRLPEGTMADLSGHLRLPRVGLGATRPLQTLIDPRAVKPDACPGTCTHASTTMLIHGPEQEHQGPTEGSQQSICAHPQAAAATAGPTTCHGVGDTRAVVHSVRHDAQGWGRAARHRSRSADLETGEACQRTSHSPQPLRRGGGGGATT